MKRPIAIIQYIRPRGERVPVLTDVSDRAAAKAEEIARAGLELTAEVVPPNYVCFSISDDAAGEDDVAEIFPNGPGLQDAIETLLLRFNEEQWRAWHDAMTDE